MGTKNEPGANDCFYAALPDEPTFTLLARDPQAAGLLLLWAREREERIAEGLCPETDRVKVAEARALAEVMREWRKEHDGEWRRKNPELPFKPAVRRFDNDIFAAPRYRDMPVREVPAINAPCPSCGKPADTKSCSMGGCPLGADL